MHACVDGAGLFVFQAEDGIRDLTVTGVQTCALPIFNTKEESEIWEAQFGVFGFKGAWTPRTYHAPDVVPPLPEGMPTTKAQAENAVDFIDRKSTRLNSSHSQISYAVFCLKKKNKWYMSDHSCDRLLRHFRTSAERPRTFPGSVHESQRICTFVAVSELLAHLVTDTDSPYS